MAKYLINQSTFQHGEVSPKFQGRRDLEEYKNCLEVLNNFFVQPQGGVTKRPGTRHLVQIQSLLHPTLPSRQLPKLIPFVFSKDQKFLVMIASTNDRDIRIFKPDGTEVSNVNNYALLPQSNYDAKNWKYSQNGDILVLTYSDPDGDNGPALALDIPPVFITRDSQDVFNIFSLSNPLDSSGIPSKLKYNHAVMRPYLAPNVNPDLRLYVSSTSTGTGRTMTCVDSSNNPVPFFNVKQVFSSSGGIPIQIGSFFKVSANSQTGVAYVTGIAPTALTLPSGDINFSTEVITYAGHGLSTGDYVSVEPALGVDNTVITDHPVRSGGVSGATYGFFYARVLTVNTFTLYETRADALSGSGSLIDFVSSVDGIRVYPVSVSSCEVTIEEDFEASLTSAANATDDWQESAWSAYRGFPRACAFHEGRLFMGGTRSFPDTLWASQTGNIVNFMQTRLDQDTTSPTRSPLSSTKFVLFGDLKPTDPFSTVLASKEANVIQWLSSQSVLTVGTEGEEFVVSGGDLPLGPSIDGASFVSSKRQTSYGSNNVQAINIGDSTIFITNDGRRLRDFKFNDRNGSYVSTNMSYLSDHMVFKQKTISSTTTLKGVSFKELYYQPNREIIWALTSNDQLVAATFSKESGIIAWHYHPFNDAYDAISSICVLPDPDSTHNRLYLIAQRGSSYFLEYIGDDFEHDFINNTSTDSNDHPHYCDASVRGVLGSSTNIVTGLSHLEGETVQVLVDGVQETDKTVASGQITLDATHPSGTIVIVGLKFTSKLQTLDIEGGGFFGTSESTRQREDRIALRLNRSQGGKYGNANQSTLFPIEYTDPDGSTNTEQFTGIKRLDFKITPDMENKIVIEHDEPLPFNLLSITHRGVSYE